MLRRLSIRDVVLVTELDLSFGPGFTVLTGETGAGKSILIDALQFALGARADAGLVREGASRAEVSAEFDRPTGLQAWLEDAGFAGGAGGAGDDDVLLLRRSIDAQGRSRAWINGSAATVAQLREAAEALVEIHGQHAWQSLTKPAAVRALLDAEAGVDGRALRSAWDHWKARRAAFDDARARRDGLDRDRERLAWQIGELGALAPAEGEWSALEAEHERLAHGQALIDGAQAAVQALSEDEPSADALLQRAIDALDAVVRHDAQLSPVLDVLRSAQALVQDAAHSLSAYRGRGEPDLQRLAELDTRLGAWMSLARRFRRRPDELPALLAGWQAELQAIDAASDLEALAQACAEAEAAWQREAKAISALRRRAAPTLASAVTTAMQQLGMDGGRFEVALVPEEAPQPHGLESVELRVAGHAGSTPRALAKVASGGELSRLALAIAVTTAAQQGQAGAPAPALIFDEIDAGVGGSVADSVGRLMKQLGAHLQVFAVTHLAQVAACADSHFVVSKALRGDRTLSEVQAVAGEARVTEIARMLGGERLAPATSRAHAEAMLGQVQRR